MSAVVNVGIVATPRDLLILRTIVIARVLDCEQVMVVASFTSVRRTNRRLLKLVQAGLLKRWFVGTSSGGQKALYGLSPEGAALIGQSRQGLISWKRDALVTTSQFLAHQQAVNAVFIASQFRSVPPEVRCGPWRVFPEPISPALQLKPDGYFELKQGSAIYPMFLEVDLGTESSRIWRNKVELYLKLALSGEFESLFQQKRFRVLVVLHSERRMHTIRKTVSQRTDKLFWFSTQDDLTRDGLCSPIWLRPRGTERANLL